MKKSVKDLYRLVRPLSTEKRKLLSMAAEYIDEEDMGLLKGYLKLDRCFGRVEQFKTTPEVFEDKEWPLFKSHLKDKDLHEFLKRIDGVIDEKARLDAFLSFAPNALDTITGQVANNIVGLDTAKRAAAIQLFAADPFHILMVGDPGTGKTDILRSLYEMSPRGSFGLGSGVSGVGLSAAAKGDEILKGLLPLADEGIACIDELNLIKAKDLASLYNAMEKGFVSYDKGTKHETLSARVRVCATANPDKQTFVGRSAEVLRKQIPFGDALVSRFHLIFVIRQPSEKEFEEIAKQIVRGKRSSIKKHDADFLKQYVAHANTLDVSLAPEFELEIVEFVKRLKRDEKKFLTEIGPRIVVGIVRIVKAIARSELSTTVNKRHLREAFELVEDALYVRKDHET